MEVSSPSASARPRSQPSLPPPGSQPHWYKDAVIYELHVRAFCDSNGDGIGDFRGLLSKLPYFGELGVNTLWLLPFYPSPLRDDGYDIADYYDVHPSYGTLTDFREFLAAAHAHGLRVITELVLNHTSDQHRWFQTARRAAPGTPERDFYVWSDDPRRYAEARIIFQDFETSNWAWDPVAKQYYWHRFYSHQPDLNFDHPAVHDALRAVIDFWLGLGVDGLRLDAVPYLYEREGTNCENLPETHAFLRKLRAHVDAKFPDRMLLAEANQWPEDAAAYFGRGDECHMEFHFPLMPRMFMALQMEDRFPIIDILEQTPPIPEACAWATFLRNHDELTLEMVTDEERDYMVRVYAADARARINLGIRRRLAPLLGNNRRKIELINSLLFSLPGTPILYYGDEIGMGDNFYLGDRHGVRTPMQWSPDRNAGFSRANPQQLYLPVISDPEYHYEAVNVETQMRNPTSLFWWMRRMIGVARQQAPFTRGRIEFLHPHNHRVLAYLREYDGEMVLVVANLSRFVQSAELDLSLYAGSRVVELFGGGEFPRLRTGPTTFTLGPHGFYWLALRPDRPGGTAVGMNRIDDAGGFDERFFDQLARNALPEYLARCAWLSGAGLGAVREVRVLDAVPLGAAQLLVLSLQFADALPELALMPVQAVSAALGTALTANDPDAAIAHLPGERMLIDALFDEGFRSELFRLLASAGQAAGTDFRLAGSPRPELAAAAEAVPSSRLLATPAASELVAYGEAWELKFYRRFARGLQPDAELTELLSHGPDAANAAPYAGSLQLHDALGQGVAAMVTRRVPHAGIAWDTVLEAIGRFAERALTHRASVGEAAAEAEVIGGVAPEMMDRLGARLAALHLALADPALPPAFAPEPFGTLSQRALYQSMRGHLGRMLRAVQEHWERLPTEARDALADSGEWQAAVRARYVRLLERKVEGGRIRVHGDLSLRRMLNTGKDWLFTDFEGDPGQPLSERILKRSPLVDLAALIRSLDLAMQEVLGRQRPEDAEFLRPWARHWLITMGTRLARSYRQGLGSAAFVPAAREDFQLLLDVLLLDDAVRDLERYVAHNPSQVPGAASFLRRLLQHPPTPTPPAHGPQ